MRLLLRWLVDALGLGVAVWLVPGFNHEGEIWTFLVVAAIFGLINAVLRPIVLFFSCPLVVLTLGLFILVVNWAMLSLTLWISGSIFNLGFTSDSFWTTFVAAIVISLVTGILNLFLKDKDD
ncbi:MAG: phage holin family protein [Chloroflexota bacterium]